jgi:hypothetical protein
VSEIVRLAGIIAADDDGARGRAAYTALRSLGIAVHQVSGRLPGGSFPILSQLAAAAVETAPNLAIGALCNSAWHGIGDWRA